jgi:aspartate dehydrogenase
MSASVRRSSNSCVTRDRADGGAGMKVAIIGCGAIGTWLAQRLGSKSEVIRRGDKLPTADVVVEAAGHEALAHYGVTALKQGSDLVVVSIGALAHDELWSDLQAAATRSKIILPAGAVVGIDALSAARRGGLDEVSYSARKPPASLSSGLPTDRETVVFEGNARQAALEFPKNANVAATIALAGVGFEATRVRIVADPKISENIHELEVRGAFGSFAMSIAGRPLPTNPKTSSLSAMSVLRCIENRQSAIVI